MAGTEVSMARSMLVGAISVAASAAAAEMSLLIGVRKDIWYVLYVDRSLVQVLQYYYSILHCACIMY